jgi:shikimate dehydrogenase
MRTFGLLGHPLGHSLSRKIFLQNFHERGLDYRLFDFPEIHTFIEHVHKEVNLYGFNVTIPHKVNIMEYLDDLSDEAQKIGSVNVVAVTRIKNNKILMKGHNTDHIGFDKSVSGIPFTRIRKAYILGTGGSAKAVKYSLDHRSVPCILVSREAASHAREVISYDQLMTSFGSDDMLINCTPAGMDGTGHAFAFTEAFFNESNVVYDLVYNPSETPLLRAARESGSVTINGIEMLEIQARESWKIWGLTA